MLTNFDLAGMAALILAVVAIWKAWKGEPKDNADAAKLWQEMSAECARKQSEMQSQITMLQTRMADLELELSAYKDGVDLLIGQLERLKQVPVWKPRRKRNG
jgi:soluble cytochrome b562